MIIDKFGNKRFKVGLHIHTTLSDGRVTPDDAARIYKEAGFDAIAITDHWKYGGEQELSGLKILSGCEYNMGASDTSVDVMHIVGVGMKYAPNIKKEDKRQYVIDEINKAGGIAILAHPAWSLNTPEEALCLKGFSAVEIYNSVSDVNQSSRPYSGYFVDLIANKGMFLNIAATDDAHYYNGSDQTKSYIMVKADSIDDIFEAIKNLDFSFLGINLTQKPQFTLNFSKADVDFKLWIIPFLSFAAAMLSGIYSSIHQKRSNPDAPNMMGMMLMMPLFSLWIAFNAPCGLGFYWACSSLIGAFIQMFINRFFSPAKLVAKEQANLITKRSAEEKKFASSKAAK